MGTLVVLVLAGCYGSLPSPVGDPDPGHQRMALLTPTLSVVPPGSKVTLRQRTEPIWDSCDAVPSTFGWDPVTVDVEWRYAGHPAQTVDHVRSVLATMGWVERDGEGTWEWSRPLPTGGRAAAMLLGGPGSDPKDWAFEATAPPATHPSHGC